MLWRLGTWGRWLVEPWRDAVLVGSLVVAVAAPVMVVAAAGLWERTARDEVAASAVSGIDLDRNGVDVAVGGVLDADGLALLDERVRAAVGAIGPIAPLDRVLVTASDTAADPRDPERRIDPSLRLLAREGAIEALDVVEQLPDTAGGVWISRWFAERNALSVGDDLLLAGPTVPATPDDEEVGRFRVVGVYETLWTEDRDVPPPPYWRDVPAELVPRWNSTTRRPFFELAIVEEDTFTSRGIQGVARWTAPLTAVPSTYDGLLSLDRQVTRLEAALVGTGPLGSAVSALANPIRPTLTTEVDETTDVAVAAASSLVDPLAATRAAGLAIGLVVAVAAGVLLAHRSRRTAVLLVSEGVGAAGLVARAAAQLVLPAVVGAGVGLLAAVGVAAWTGRRVLDWTTTVDVAELVVTAAAAMLLVAVVSGLLGSRVLRPTHRDVARTLGVLVPVLVATAAGAAWLQAGRTTVGGVGTVDLVTVGLPVLVAAAVALVLLAALGTSLRHLGRRLGPETSPTTVVLVQRLAGGGLALRGASVALAVGLSLAGFALLLEDTLAERTDVAVAAIVGADAQVSFTGDVRPDQVPEETTVVRSLLTRSVPGNAFTRVLAVDEATFASVVAWPAAFGGTAEEVVELIGAETDPTGRLGVPVVAIAGQDVPDEGAFGETQPVPFRVVGRVNAVPLLDERGITLLTTVAALDGRTIAGAGLTSRAEAEEEGLRLPTGIFTERMVSQLGVGELVDATERVGLRPLDELSAAGQLGDPALVAAGAALEFLLVLGVVAAAVAVAALLLLAATRRRERALAAVLLRAMGQRRRSALVVATLETAVVVALAVVAALVTAPIALRRLVDGFDPSPSLPVTLGVTVPWSAMVVVGAAVVVVGAVAVAALEQRAGGRSAAEVLRAG